MTGDEMLARLREDVVAYLKNPGGENVASRSELIEKLEAASPSPDVRAAYRNHVRTCWELTDELRFHLLDAFDEIDTVHEQNLESRSDPREAVQAETIARLREAVQDARDTATYIGSLGGPSAVGLNALGSRLRSALSDAADTASPRLSGEFLHEQGRVITIPSPLGPDARDEYLAAFEAPPDGVFRLTEAQVEEIRQRLFGYAPVGLSLQQARWLFRAYAEVRK